MTTVIVGGGPTGVEMAGAVAELARHALARDFRIIDPRRAKIVLIEAGPRILAGFPEKLSDYAKTALERLGVTVITKEAVESIDATGVVVAGRRIDAGTVIWGAGIKASPAAGWLGAALDRAGRVPLNPDLSVKGVADVYALGDIASTPDENGTPLPALAQVAAQQGHYLGRALAENFKDGKPMPPFKFHNRGNTAIVGRHAAVFDFGWMQLKGRFAWLMWAVIHVYLLVGFDNRLRVTLQWLWAYITYERGARLIMRDFEFVSDRYSSSGFARSATGFGVASTPATIFCIASPLTGSISMLSLAVSATKSGSFIAARNAARSARKRGSGTSGRRRHRTAERRARHDEVDELAVRLRS